MGRIAQMIPIALAAQLAHACHSRVDSQLQGVWAVVSVCEDGTEHRYGWNRALVTIDGDAIKIAECAYFNDTDETFEQQTHRQCPGNILRSVAEERITRFDGKLLVYSMHSFIPQCERPDGDCGVSPRPVAWPILGERMSGADLFPDGRLRLSHSAGRDAVR